MIRIDKKILIGVFVAGLGLISMVMARVQPTLDDRVKAAYLYNFARFVEWPAEAFPTPETKFVIGVVGDSDFADYLRATTAEHTVNGRPISVVSLEPNSSQINRVHVVFVTNEISDPTPVLQKASGSDVLTVGESRSFTRQGGMIRFVIENDALRFSVNSTAVDRSHLKISSQMLQFAKTGTSAR
jgi:hypothetical protein